MYFYRYILLILLGIICHGCNNRADSPEAYEHLKSFSQGTMEKDKYFKLLAQEFPDNDYAWMERSVPYNKRGDLENGMKFLTKAVKINPGGNVGYRGYVMLYMMHDYEQALKDFKRLLELSSDKNPVAWGENLHKLIGLTFLLQNEYDTALNYLDKGIILTTEEFSEAYVEQRSFLYKSYAHFHLKNYDSALVTLQKALAIENRFPEAHYLKAKIYKNKGLYQQALASINTSDTLFNKYGAATNAYYEMPYQLYASQINELKDQINKAL